jgi:hypothetical protein
MVTEPVTPDAVAVQVLDALDAVNGSCVDVLIESILVEEVSEPVGPVEARASTVIGPELKNLAGPTTALPEGALALCGLLDPLETRVTVGEGPRVFTGPPNKLTFRRYP